MDERNAGKALGLLRVMLGLWLIWLALPNLDHSFLEKLPGVLENYAATNPFPLYRWFLQQIAVPQAEFFGSIISVGQMLVGSAILIGFLGRFAASLGVFYSVNLYLATSHMGFYYQSFSILLLLVLSAIAMGDAGRFYGVDGFLFKSGESKGKRKKSKSDDSGKFKFKDKKQQQAIEALNRQLKKNASRHKKVKVEAD